MGDEVGKSDTSDGPTQYKITSIRSSDYRLEFINGAISNITSQGEIVCNFHFESKDMPMEQIAIAVEDGSGTAKLAPLRDPGTFTRDIKFGIIMNISFAKNLVILLNQKIEEAEGNTTKKAKNGGVR